MDWSLEKEFYGSAGAKEARLGKLTCMWDDGVYVGIKGSTGEVMVADGRGVWVTRTVRRKTLEDRWQQKNSELVVGLPWDGKRPGEEGREAARMEVRSIDKDYKERMELEKDEYIIEPVGCT